VLQQVFTQKPIEPKLAVTIFISLTLTSCLYSQPMRMLKMNRI